jgi:hypothetical protein
VPDATAPLPLDRISLLQRAAHASAWRTGETKRAVALIKLALAGVDTATEPLRTGALLNLTGRSPGRSSSATRPPAFTYPTSWPSSASPATPPRRPGRTALASPSRTHQQGHRGRFGRSSSATLQHP